MLIIAMRLVATSDFPRDLCFLTVGFFCSLLIRFFFSLLKAYCKIDGVPTDILINGNVGQNRAVSLVYFLYIKELPDLFFFLQSIYYLFSFWPMLERFYFSSLVGFLSSDLCFFM